MDPSLRFSASCEVELPQKPNYEAEKMTNELSVTNMLVVHIRL